MGAPIDGGDSRDASSVACLPLDCSTLDYACGRGVCDESTRSCTVVNLPDGERCDTRCITDGTCSNGDCTGGTSKDCSTRDSPCNVGVCDPTNGECIRMPTSEGMVCNDENPCTLDDACHVGSCRGTPKNCVDSENLCNRGTCRFETGECEYAPAPDGAICDDGNSCTLPDTCRSGVCVGGTEDCSDGSDPCRVGVCNAVTERCDMVPVENGTLCSDNQECTTDDACQDGVCVGDILGCIDFIETMVTPSCDNMRDSTTFPDMTDQGDDDDDAISAVTPIGFTFELVDTLTTHFWMSGNGFIVLNAGGDAMYRGGYLNQSLPNPNPPAGVIAPFWDDLNPITGVTQAHYKLFGTAPNRHLTVEWSRYTFFAERADSPTAELTFQVKLFETSNVIEFHYCRMRPGEKPQTPTGSSATVGVESIPGTEGLQHSFDTPDSVSIDVALRFNPTS